MVNESIILQVLAEQKEETLKFKEKKLVSRVEENLFEQNTNLAQVVIGVRRSGKSTLCHKVLNSWGVEYAYVNFDDDRLSSLCTEDLNTVLSCLYVLYGVDIPYLFLDEIQNIDGWYLFVNRLLRTDLKIFVTGSNAKLLSGELATHLTGRYNEIQLFPFSFSEYCEFHAIDSNSPTTKSEAKRKLALLDYINNGGFPEIQGLNNKRAYIEGLLKAILQKDIKNRFKIRNIEALRKIANHLINNACQEINYDELSKVFDISSKTIQNYVSYLQQAFLIHTLSKYSYKSIERIRGEKSYTIDPGLINNREQNFASENLGWRLENVVYIELLRRCSNKYLDIYYYKPRSRDKEVDFVICHNSRALQLVQVSYDIGSEKTLKRECSALVVASEALNCNELYIITYSTSTEITINGKSIHVVSVIDWLLKADNSHTYSLNI